MTGALHNLKLQLSPPLPSSFASINPANPGSPGKVAVKTERVVVVGVGLGTTTTTRIIVAF